jgi:hypothetical protein
LDAAAAGTEWPVCACGCLRPVKPDPQCGKPTKYADTVECRKTVKRARERERRLADPEGWAAQMAAQSVREQDRKARGNDKWPRLPARPLAEFIGERRARSTESDEALCARYGTTSRTYTRWRTGGAQTTPFEVADRLIQLAGVAWSDVYVQCEDRCGKPECWRCDGYRQAKLLFEPDRMVLALDDDLSDLDFFPGGSRRGGGMKPLRREAYTLSVYVGKVCLSCPGGDRVWLSEDELRGLCLVDGPTALAALHAQNPGTAALDRDSER